MDKIIRNTLLTLWSISCGLEGAILLPAILEPDSSMSMPTWIWRLGFAFLLVVVIGIGIMSIFRVYVTQRELMRFFGVIMMTCGIFAYLAQAFLARIYATSPGFYLIIIGGSGLAFFVRSFMPSKQELEQTRL